MQVVLEKMSRARSKSYVRSHVYDIFSQQSKRIKLDHTYTKPHVTYADVVSHSKPSRLKKLQTLQASNESNDHSYAAHSKILDSNVNSLNNVTSNEARLCTTTLPISSSNTTDHTYSLPKLTYADVVSGSKPSSISTESTTSQDHRPTSIDHSYAAPSQITETLNTANEASLCTTSSDHEYVCIEQNSTLLCQPKIVKPNHSVYKVLLPVTESACNVSCTYHPGNVSVVELNEKSFTVQNVPGDGDCFFHAISLFLNDSYDVDMQQRKLICGEILDNFSVWKHSTDIHHDNISKTMYFEKMLKRKGWATASEIQAASVVLDLEINVFFVTQNNVHTENVIKTTYSPEFGGICHKNNTRSINLLLKNNHFMLLTPSNKPIQLFQSQDQCQSTQNKQAPHHKTYDDVSTCNTKTEKYLVNILNNDNTCNIKVLPNKKMHNKRKATETSYEDNSVRSSCRKIGIAFEECETGCESESEFKARERRNVSRIKYKLKKLDISLETIPEAPPLTDDKKYNETMDCIRSFELQQMSYKFSLCTICHERRLQMKLHHGSICSKCFSDKNEIKKFSDENNMNPGTVPDELQNLTEIEQQLIAQISPCINVHLLKHGGLASKGHCVTFPQDISEPVKLLPRLASEINIIRVRREGKNDTSKEFRVRRYTVQKALEWLKKKNPVYSNIEICPQRLSQLPLDGEFNDLHTVEFSDNTVHMNDEGPAKDQVDPGELEPDAETKSGVLLQDDCLNIQKEKDNVISNLLNGNKSKSTVTIPWPTRSTEPISEYTTHYFFTLAFPALFPHGKADFFMNRPISSVSLSDWANHLLWYSDGRFAKHHIFKFIIHNMIIRKRTLEQSNFIVQQKLGDEHLTISDLKDKIKNGDKSFGEKLLYFGTNLRGTSQYWSQRRKELRSLIQFKINEGRGLPSFFATGSCAEFYFKPLKRIIKMYIKETTGQDIDLTNKNNMFKALQNNSHIVADYFDKRTQSYFNEVLSPAFQVDTYWYRQEFAKSRGMIHWHGLCWRSDSEPHNLLHDAFTAEMSPESIALKLSEWADENFKMTASHPAGKDELGYPRKDFWPPPEGTAPAPPQEKNPLIKLLLDVSDSQESIIEDHLLLTNRINLHRCSDYCLRIPKHGRSKSEKVCRMEFGTTDSPGKILRSEPAIIKDKNGCQRLEMIRDHPSIVQHSKYHTQGWRANGDISIILSKSDPKNPSVDDIIATEQYITGYACKGNEPTGAVVDLFNDMVNTTDDDVSAKSVCTKLLMQTTKRDISAVEASFELSSLPLFRCSYSFQNVSMTGSRLLEKSGATLTKQTSLDKYINRDKNNKDSWYNYICKSGSVPVISGGSLKCTWPLHEEYCRSMTLLHWPNWRNISDIKTNTMSWPGVFEEFLKSPQCPNFVLADVERARRHTKQEQNDENDSAHADDHEDNNECDQPEWMELIRPQAEFTMFDQDFEYNDGGPDHDWSNYQNDYPHDLGIKFIEEIRTNYECSDDNVNVETGAEISNLNSDQKFAYDIILKTLLDFKESKTKYTPLRLIVAGTAGSGKSYLIKCLVKSIRSLFDSKNAVQVLCPTGNSANIISGQTIHSFLKIPTTSRNKEMCAPKGKSGEALQERCKDLKVLLIDERSLIGCNTLGWMEFMCRHGVNKGENIKSSWGGLPVVVVFGDDVQLPPVLDSPLYVPNTKSPASLHGSMVWQEFNQAVVLRTIIRQNEQQQEFKNVLNALREYKATPEHTKWLQQFQWNNVKQNFGEALVTRMDNLGLFVFPTHREESKHNVRKLLDANKIHPVARIYAINEGIHAANIPTDKAGGLLKYLYLCKGSTVMLTSNLHVPYGLFNGSVGTVVDIIYPVNENPKTSLPTVVMVEFHKFTGPHFISDKPKIVPIAPIKRKIDCLCYNCSRTQIPLRLGWGTTIHRCQGMTIGEGESFRYIVINPGTRKFESQNPGALFVALSRAKTAGSSIQDPDFAWNPAVFINEDRICHLVNTPTTRARAIEIQRIEKLSVKTFQEYSLILKNCSNYHNLQHSQSSLTQSHVEE